MRTVLKIIFLSFVFLSNYSCAQVVTLRTPSQAKLMEANKKDFIGKSLSYFLDHIKLEIKSLVPTPNKDPKEVNRLSFIFVPYSEYRKTPDNEKPVRITVIFNQGWDWQDSKNRCKSSIPDCITWTKEDEKKLGDLKIIDIYVTGKE